MKHKKYIQGDKYIGFVLVKPLGALHTAGTKKVRSYWLCKCNCGNEKVLEISKIGITKSCGCVTKGAKTHGESKLIDGKCIPEYKTWMKLRSRCYSEKDPKYKDYGARGIKVCDRWLNSYENFLEDMGRRPDDKKSIDRINNNGDYEPDNCRWADDYQQQRNTRRNHILEYRGESKPLMEWVNELNLNYYAVLKRILYRGWSVDEAFETPIRIR